MRQEKGEKAMGKKRGKKKGEKVDLENVRKKEGRKEKSAGGCATDRKKCSIGACQSADE